MLQGKKKKILQYFVAIGGPIPTSAQRIMILLVFWLYKSIEGPNFENQTTKIAVLVFSLSQISLQSWVYSNCSYVKGSETVHFIYDQSEGGL